jgi:hypothetical protein
MFRSLWNEFWQRAEWHQFDSNVDGRTPLMATWKRAHKMHERGQL